MFFGCEPKFAHFRQHRFWGTPGKNQHSTWQGPSNNLQNPQSFWVVPGKPVRFCVASPQTSATSKHGRKGLPTQPFPTWWRVGSAQKSILDIFFRPERSTALAFDWNLLTDWWSVGTSEDGGSPDGGEIPQKITKGNCGRNTWNHLNHPLNYDFGFKMFAIFQAVSGGNTMPAHQKYRCVCIIVFIYIYDMYFLCDVYL